jgi:hypothetical protein
MYVYESGQGADLGVSCSRGCCVQGLYVSRLVLKGFAALLLAYVSRTPLFDLFFLSAW